MEQLTSQFRFAPELLGSGLEKMQFLPSTAQVLHGTWPSGWRTVLQVNEKSRFVCGRQLALTQS